MKKDTSIEAFDEAVNWHRGRSTLPYDWVSYGNPQWQAVKYHVKELEDTNAKLHTELIAKDVFWQEKCDKLKSWMKTKKGAIHKHVRYEQELKEDLKGCTETLVSVDKLKRSRDNSLSSTRGSLEPVPSLAKSKAQEETLAKERKKWDEARDGYLSLIRERGERLALKQKQVVWLAIHAEHVNRMLSRGCYMVNRKFMEKPEDWIKAAEEAISSAGLCDKRKEVRSDTELD